MTVDYSKLILTNVGRTSVDVSSDYYTVNVQRIVARERNALHRDLHYNLNRCFPSGNEITVYLIVGNDNCESWHDETDVDLLIALLNCESSVFKVTIGCCGGCND